MEDKEKRDIVWHHGKLTPAAREKSLGGRGAVVWFTGLPCSGKSSLAREVEAALVEGGVNAAVLDGDNIRHGLNRDLGFSPADRAENIRRIGEVAKLFVQNNVVALTAFISPYRSDRAAARALVAPGEFFEVFCDAPLAVCEQRDTKGQYAKARAGRIPEFTGVSAPYEPPDKPELTLKTGEETLEQSARRVLDLLKKAGLGRRLRRD
ncbi:MAG TPA: adenylyl-sulfate kinase [Elusimicrobiota bacterium]|nr:adenylyl-sulfate kinase [Elusimicrobiota bacterium]